MISFLLSLIVATGAFAEDVIPAGCTASRNFSAEAYKVWVSAGTKESATEDAAQSKAIPVGERVELQLVATETVSKGFVKFEVPAEGTYIIATDAYPRFDLTNLATGENVDPVDFGKVRDCGTVSKALRFQFAAGSKFLLGFTSSEGPILNILIWKLN